MAGIRKGKTFDKSPFNMANEEEPVVDLDPADEVVVIAHSINLETANPSRQVGVCSERLSPWSC